jgi:hypothetical protein
MENIGTNRSGDYHWLIDVPTKSPEWLQIYFRKSRAWKVLDLVKKLLREMPSPIENL